MSKNKYLFVLEKNSSDSDEPTVVLPTKRAQKANPNIQSTGERRKVEIVDDDAGSSDNETVSDIMNNYLLKLRLFRHLQ